MKKIATICLILPLLLLNVVPSLAIESQQNVYMRFENGYGIRISIWNYNDYAITNVHLKVLFLGGLILCGFSGVTTLYEIQAGGYGYLIIPVFGFGWAIASAVITYDDQGEHVEKQVSADLFIIGSVVHVINQW